MARQADIHVRNHGGILVFDPRTSRGVAWVEENIGADNGFQPYYPSVICEARYADDIIDGMRADGLRIA